MGTATRHRILEEAARLFTEKGYEATSVQELAEALGLSKAALYHHFPSKEEILYEISQEALKGLLREGEKALAAPTPQEALLRFMELTPAFLRKTGPFLSPCSRDSQASPRRRGRRPWPYGTGTRAS